MSNFFDEFLYNKEQFALLTNAYRGVFELLNENIREIDRRTSISKLLTYKRIGFQRINITDAIYSISNLLNNGTVILNLGLDISASYSQKLSKWNSLSLMKKVELLDVAGYSALLVGYIGSDSDNNPISSKFNIVDFELTDTNNNAYVRNVDYVFQDNKIFLLREFSSDELYRSKFLIMRDIVIDTSTTEDVLGSTLQIPYTEEFTKMEYNETLRSFVEAAAGGPTLNNLNQSLSRYKTLEGVKVYDRYSAPESKQSFWGHDGYVGNLTTFDFLVALPLKFAYNSERLQCITNFFGKIKPAYTNFAFAPLMDVSDSLLLKYQRDEVTMSTSFGMNDDVTAKEERKFVVKREFNENYSVNDQTLADHDDVWDSNVLCDVFTFVEHPHLNPTYHAADIIRSVERHKLSGDVGLSDKISAKEISKFIVRRSFMEKYSYKDQTVSDDDDKFDSNAMYDIFTLFEHHKLNTSYKIKDYIRSKDNLLLLNRLKAYDRIVNRKDVLSRSASSKRLDVICRPEAANVVYCDGILCFDDIGGIFYDNADKSSSSKECISLRLIPK